MGIDSLPQRRMYWQGDTRHATVADVLSRDRFESITRYLTVSPPVADAAPRNPFSFVRAFIASLNHSFPRHWNPGRHLALDESMVSFRGRSDIKQFVPGKPHPHGYKIWVLANENYMLQLQLYEGKAAAGPSIHDMVLQLTQLYRNNNHVLYIDSLFTSPTLVASLFNVGIRVCGSVKRNRIGMPSTAALPPAQLTAIPRGAHLQMQRGDVTLCAWRDKKLILLLTITLIPQLTTMQRWGDDGVIYQLGCPQAIRDYFHHARAVDVINQLHYSYLPGRKSRKCWTRLVWWLIDICILNAFRLWQVQHPDESRTSPSACSWLTSSWSVCRPSGGHSAQHTLPLVVQRWRRITTLCSPRREADCVHCSDQPDTAGHDPLHLREVRRASLLRGMLLCLSLMRQRTLYAYTLPCQVDVLRERADGVEEVGAPIGA